MPGEKRNFTIQGSEIGFEGGLYKSTEPSLAAKKAAKQLFRMIENKQKKSAWHKYEKYSNHKDLKFIIRETTQGSDKKTYFYESTIVPLKNPKEITRNGVTYTVTKDVKVKSCSEHLCTALLKKK